MGVFYPSHHCDSACEEPHGEEHSDECICESCHEAHHEDGMQNFVGLQCCDDEINFMVETGKWCAKHRLPCIDIADTICAECEKGL